MIKWRMKNQHHWASYYQDNLYYLLIIEDEKDHWREFGVNGINESYRQTYDIPESSYPEIKEIMMDANLKQNFDIISYLTSKRVY